MENHTQRKKGISSSIYLPVDVVENILSRLPVKFLVRFKTVSKSWHDIISDPRFSRIPLHVQQSKSSQNLFLLWAYPPGNFSLIKLENQKFITESVLEFPFGPSLPLRTCNGILLLGNVKKGFIDGFVLWNPSIRRYYARIVFPLKRPICWPFNFGLYHDSRIDDYKVVITSKEHYTIYSCKNTSWTETKTLPFSSTGLHPYSGIFVDESFYWLTEESSKGEIVCFDVRDEKLNKLSQPSDLELANDTDEVQLISLSGRLCQDLVNRDRTKLQLWLMEKHGHSNYSWRELMNMEKEEPDLLFRWPICLTNEDNVVILLQSSKLVIYNHCEKSFKNLEVPFHTFTAIQSSDIFPYSESLYFPIQNQAEGVSDN